ncbi:hypothetical protein JI435_303550, partial [Parastagonospora nodorum SN15]
CTTEGPVYPSSSSVIMKDLRKYLGHSSMTYNTRVFLKDLQRQTAWECPTPTSSADGPHLTFGDHLSRSITTNQRYFPEHIAPARRSPTIHSRFSLLTLRLRKIELITLRKPRYQTLHHMPTSMSRYTCLHYHIASPTSTMHHMMLYMGFPAISEGVGGGITWSHLCLWLTMR